MAKISWARSPEAQKLLFVPGRHRPAPQWVVPVLQEQSVLPSHTTDPPIQVSIGCLQGDICPESPNSSSTRGGGGCSDKEEGMMEKN